MFFLLKGVQQQIKRQNTLELLSQGYQCRVFKFCGWPRKRRAEFETALRVVLIKE